MSTKKKTTLRSTYNKINKETNSMAGGVSFIEGMLNAIEDFEDNELKFELEEIKDNNDLGMMIKVTNIKDGNGKKRKKR